MAALAALSSLPTSAKTPEGAANVVSTFLKASGTKYPFTVAASAGEGTVSIVDVTFSEPTQMSPVAITVVRTKFMVDTGASPSIKFKMEQEGFTHSLADEVAWNDAWVDAYIKSKLSLRFAVDLDDEADSKILQPGKWVDNQIDEAVSVGESKSS